MRDFQEVNQLYFREAIEEWNDSPIRAELNLTKFSLGPELKEITLQTFMAQVESIPPEKEAMITSKVVEIYNHLFDPAYVIPEGLFNQKEEVKMTEEIGTEAVVETPVEATAEAKPVKEKKERKPREPKAPKEPKGPSRKFQVYQAWVNNKDISVNDLMQVVEGLSKNTVSSWKNTWKSGKNLPSGVSV
jgi:hypothetical protein